ncbi:MAG TPA: glycoside hydrolase family 2 TIM barrel-domain containing protein [Pyrinomonadaceae bacterium]|nr:glycoside hydrolase family 2 TIM barrel-domain containing protein [Pyrinomonadaceae bacterium]
MKFSIKSRKFAPVFIYEIFSVCSILLIFTPSINAQNSRLNYQINDNWSFSFDESKDKIKTVSLPHTWNDKDVFDDEVGYRRGISWYRRELKLDLNLKNKRLFLYFEGVNQTAEVFLNDKSLGKHIGGYTAFVFEITESIDFNKPNQLLVKVDNTLLKDIPPLDADFNMYGGIYRNVWLIATDEIHFKVTDFASSGVRLETPQVAEGSATVKVSGTVVNSSEKLKQIEVVSTIFDKQNRQVSVLNSTITVNPKGETDFQQTSKLIYKPKLWSPDNPILYTVKTTIKDGAKTLDELTQRLGLRWFKFDAEQGFFLNGKPLKLRGTNKHQDYTSLGNAVPENLQIRDLEIIKENGFNFLRLAHYPQNKAVLEAADRLGIMIWEEIPVVNLITISEGFNQNAKTMLTEMIRQHRNHPSIIIWGYMNEVFLRSPKTEADVRETVKLAKALEKICKTEDSSRVTAIAFDGGNTERYYTSGLAEVTDVVGWNLYQGWYSGVFEDFGKFLDAQHKRLPNRPLIISEYGANGDRRVHSLAPKRFDSSIEWQQLFHESYLPEINARSFIAGSAIWNQFDFGSEFRGETIPHINQKGMFTYDRQPKDISFYYKANFSKTPVLHIAARDWQKRSGNSKQTIKVYSNLKKVELFQNGNSLGEKEIYSNHKTVWNVEFKDGQNLFIAKGLDGKKNVEDSAAVNYVNPNNFAEIAVNVGSNTEFLDENKVIWQADQPYQKSSWGFIGNDSKMTETLRNILKTEEEPVFQTIREGLSGYRFDAPNGDYEVELRFVETKFTEVGKRIFDVKINGETKLEKLDLIKESKFMQAFTKQFRVTAKNNDGIEISFTANKEQPILSGLRIRRL